MNDRSEVKARYLGLVAYEPTWRAMLPLTVAMPFSMRSGEIS